MLVHQGKECSGIPDLFCTGTQISHRITTARTDQKHMIGQIIIRAITTSMAIHGLPQAPAGIDGQDHAHRARFRVTTGDVQLALDGHAPHAENRNLDALETLAFDGVVRNTLGLPHFNGQVSHFGGIPYVGVVSKYTTPYSKCGLNARQSGDQGPILGKFNSVSGPPLDSRSWPWYTAAKIPIAWSRAASRLRRGV